MDIFARSLASLGSGYFKGQDDLAAQQRNTASDLRADNADQRAQNVNDMAMKLDAEQLLASPLARARQALVNQGLQAHLGDIDAPTSRTTNTGIEDWNPKTGRYDPSLESNGQQAMPYVKPSAGPKVISEGFVTKAGGPVTIQDGKFFDGVGNPLGVNDVHRYAAPVHDPNPKYQIVKDDKTGTYSRVRVDGPEGPLDQTFARTGGAGSGKPMAGPQAPIGDMIARFNELKGHAKDIANGAFQFGPENATREALQFGSAFAQNEGKPAIGTTLGGGLMDTFGLTNPKTQDRYDMMATSNRAFGDDAAKVFKGRQGFQNIALEGAQQKFSPSDIGKPDKVQQKLDRMRHIIELALTVSPEQAAGIDPAALAEFGHTPPPPRSPSPTIQQGGAGKIDAAHFAQLTPADQAYFRQQGRAP